MYVLNPTDSNLITFPKVVQRYLIACGVPLYSTIDGNFYFRKSKLLDKVLGEAPDNILKILEEEVECIGKKIRLRCKKRGIFGRSK